jgi:hypothetical protein
MEVVFPIEFLVSGTPVSLSTENPLARDQWKDRVRTASSRCLPSPHFASNERCAATIYYFPAQRMQGDVDNIVKFILDAMKQYIFIDDRQVERVVVQKFEPGNVFNFANPSETLIEALNSDKPLVYIRVSNDPFEELL